jgi:hypothetical protein
LLKASTAFVEPHKTIFIGNVNAQTPARTRMAKSVLDAGRSLFLRALLQDKCDDASVRFEDIPQLVQKEHGLVGL